MKESNVLLEKSLKFAARIVKLYQYLVKEKKESIIAKQIIRSGTSIGANANGDASLKYPGFCNIISSINKNFTKECDYMKKLIALVLVLVCVLGLVGCSNPPKETVMFNEQTFDKADLSQETLEWLEWYNGLTEAEQLAVDYIPADLCGNVNADGLTSETE